jgi:tripartite-type tricarboxylate transporter receptor subunit TctC
MSKIFQSFIFGFGLLIVMTSNVFGQPYPNRPVTIVNPLSAGGGADTFLRALAKEMQPFLGQPVLVENRPGGNGMIAGEYIARAKPDGYVIGDLQSPQVAPDVFAPLRKPPYSAEDIRIVVRVFYLPSAMVSKSTAPWKVMQDFVKFAQNNPNKVSFAETAGEGHPLHLLGRSIFSKNQMQLNEIPYKGAGDAINALLGGHVDVGYPLSVSSVQGHVQNQKLLILAVDSAQRLPSLPDVPTLKELGFDPDMAPNYHVFAVPKGTPEDVVKKIHDAVKSALETTAMKEFARKSLSTIYYGSEKTAVEEIAQNRRQITPLLEELTKKKK